MNDERRPGVIYLDSSALVKLVIAERDSDALRDFMSQHPTRVSCALARVEVLRAVGRHGEVALQRARDVLDFVRLLTIDDALLEMAADLPPFILRSLDAIHLAAALSIEDDLEVLVTYDLRMKDAAVALGVNCVAPQ